MPRKTRLDQLMVDRGLVENRTRAQSLIMAGRVFSGARRLEKPGHGVSSEIDLSVRGNDHPWVSRGGLKLAHGLKHFDIDPKGLICLDVGASTGGFTDVLLSQGALEVYAVDVGHGQLHWRLRNDPKVIVLEKTNARYLSAEHIPEAPNLVVSDVSFISLTVALPAALALAASGAHLVTLIKPQFEVGRGQVGKGGVVRDPVLHEDVCNQIIHWLDQQPGWHSLGIVPSPITGPRGNVEFLLAGQKA